MSLKGGDQEGIRQPSARPSRAVGGRSKGMVDIQELGGSSVGGYQLIRCLGHGTHTAVYRATGSLGSPWALKVIDRQLEPEATLVERLRREASLCSRVDHPAILPMYDVGRDEHVTFATAPFLEAPTLADTRVAPTATTH